MSTCSAGLGADGSAHRLVGGAQDIDRINLNRIDDSDGPRDSPVADQFMVNFVAAFREKLFRIVKPAMPKFFGQDDCGSYDRASQRPATCLVDTGDR
jgi:hypothetical protein